MPELGKTLSQARVARGLTLEDCERDTRISKRYLDALEREDWKVFPAPVYSRAFLRTYASYLGLSAQELMRMFHAQTEEPVFKPLPEIRTASSSGSANWALAGGVLVFLIVAGALLYMSSRGDDPATVTTDPGGVDAPVETEGFGGGPPPAPGRAVGEVVRGTVPDLNGVRLEDAIAALGEAELEYLVVETNEVEGTPGIVASQDPAPGTEPDGDRAVTLVVPLGG
jgi:transcriptional regulator with XRE-family HTH domain